MPNVWYWENSGKHLLAVSFSHFGPNADFAIHVDQGLPQPCLKRAARSRRLASRASVVRSKFLDLPPEKLPDKFPENSCLGNKCQSKQDRSKVGNPGPINDGVCQS